MINKPISININIFHTQVLKKLLHFKFILLKERCWRLSFAEYQNYLKTITFIDGIPKTFTSASQALNKINVNLIIEYLNYQAITLTTDLGGITSELLKLNE